MELHHTKKDLNKIAFAYSMGRLLPNLGGIGVAVAIAMAVMIVLLSKRKKKNESVFGKQMLL